MEGFICKIVVLPNDASVEKMPREGLAYPLHGAFAGLTGKMGNLARGRPTFGLCVEIGVHDFLASAAPANPASKAVPMISARGSARAGALVTASFHRPGRYPLAFSTAALSIRASSITAVAP